MTGRTITISRIEGTNYKVTLRTGDGIVQCQVSATLPELDLIGDQRADEPRRKRVILEKAIRLADALKLALHNEL